jgi:hypothetical protein
MAASHQAARLAAASLHLPVNPTTQARVAQYEREDPVQALVAAAALEEEEPEQVVRPTRALVMWELDVGGGLVPVPTRERGLETLCPVQTLPPSLVIPVHSFSLSSPQISKRRCLNL